jgi:hypothetical protein
MTYTGNFGANQFITTGTDGYLEPKAKGSSGDLLAADGSVLTLSTGLNISGGTISGTTGPTGPAGPKGQSSSYYLYKANTGSTSGDPGTGYIIWDNATQGSATQLNINHLDQDNVDIDIFLALLTQNDTITIQDKNNSANYQTWEVSGATTPQSGYIEVPVTLVGGAYPFSNDDDIIIAITNVGPQGPTGPTGPAGADTSLLTINQQIISYTLALSDKGNMVVITSGSPTTLTVPLDATVNFSIGTQILVVRGGAGAMDIAGAVGVTINSAQGYKTLNYQNSAATLVKTGTDTWYLFGDLKSP